jgi:heptaprenyl diphosphate synthase
MKVQITNKISYSYLRQFIKNPNIEEDRILLIISMLDNHGLTKLEMEDFVVTTMLVQIALDTHERVSNSSDYSLMEDNLKPRQLTVLAGIYYSSLYYKILANANNLAMIRVLAEGIKEVNEHKIFFYQKDSDGIEKLMSSIMTIESALIKKVADYFHEGVWKELSSQFLFIKRLLFEKNLFIQHESSHLFEALSKIVFHKNSRQLELTLEQKNHLLNICDKHIENSRKIIEMSLQKLPSVNEDFKRIWSKLLLQQGPMAKTFVEEG